MMKDPDPRGGDKLAVVSKMYFHAMNGGGLVLTKYYLGGKDEVVFRVDGCGVLSRELVVRDMDSDPLLRIYREKRGRVEAIRKKWKGYSSLDYQKLVSTAKEVNNNPCSFSSSRNNCAIRISTEVCNLEIRGCFRDRNCLLVNSSGKTLAKVCTKKNDVARTKDMYHVVVTAGIDRAFVCGVVAVVDHINAESTSC